MPDDEPSAPAYAYSGAPRQDDRGARRRLGVATLLGVLFVAVAIAKPWGSPVPAPSDAPDPQVAAAASPGSFAAPRVVTIGPVVAEPNPAIVAFTMPSLAPAASPWTGLRWTALASDDPLRLVTSVVRWSGGFVALGQDRPGLDVTPSWTSSDGIHWDPVPFGGTGTFAPGTSLVGVAGVPGGLVALTQARTDCGSPLCAPAVGPPVVAWTSPDGRTWQPKELPALAGPSNRRLMLAGGPAGLVAAESDAGPDILLSADGLVWFRSAAGTVPADVVLNDLRATSDGYLGAGLRFEGATRWQAVTLWSTDARLWTVTPAPQATPRRIPAGAAGRLETVATSIRAGSAGAVALGRDVVWPGSALWWQSSDGRHWSANPTFAPLGPLGCASSSCDIEPGGWLLGDGTRLVAVRGGPAAAAWSSADGDSWLPVEMSGDLPDDGATATALLPGGVVMTDGSLAWLGVPAETVGFGP